MMKMPFNSRHPNWRPLERAVKAAGLPESEMTSWMWMCEEPQGTHQYKHRGTRGYAFLSADTDEQKAIARVNFARDDGRWGFEPK